MMTSYPYTEWVGHTAEQAPEPALIRGSIAWRRMHQAGGGFWNLYAHKSPGPPLTPLVEEANRGGTRAHQSLVLAGELQAAELAGRDRESDEAHQADLAKAAGT